MKQHRTVLDLTPKKALDFFLESQNYCSIPLPKYFRFDAILNFVKEKIGNTSFNQCVKNHSLLSYDNVCYKLLLNKDGRYAYRPLQLTNPFLYYFLAREITKPNNWNIIKERFDKKFRRTNIEVASIPALKGENDKSEVATAIKFWWEDIEQRSIELSLKYKYIFITDIANCYSSIYTHSIAWAVHEKQTAKSNRGDNYFGNLIDKYIREMQYGQTNGIPQGSVLFDFIAEIVLGYSDYMLDEELQHAKITNYRILRYRDDYRIFSDSKEELERIAMLLQKTLSELNFQLNSSKTKLSEDIIKSSIKADKLFYIENLPIYKGEGTVFNTPQQELLYILCLSKKFPNSGSLSKLLNMFLRRISKMETLFDIKVLLAIVTEIAMDSPKIHNLVVSIISHLIKRVDDPIEREDLVNNVYKKFSRLPNIGFLQLWMQRMTLPMNTPLNFQEKLCRIVNGERGIEIWNNEWLKDNFTDDFPLYKMISAVEIGKITPAINVDEVSVFDHY